MTTINHNGAQTRECIGEIFPDLGKARLNILSGGKVFSALIKSHGLGIQSEELSVDEAQWKSCMECPQFDACYKLSMAKLAFQTAVYARFH
jgi:hypothetical protein